MKKILLVSGCSFTTDNFNSLFHPEISCDWPKWPKLLANKLDMDLINLANSGAGNEYIYSTLIDKISEINPKNIGLTIAAWSQSQRCDYEIRDTSRWLHERIDEKGDIHYFVRKSLRYYYSFQLLCERLDIPYKQMQMIELFDDYLNGLKGLPGKNNERTILYPKNKSISRDKVNASFCTHSIFDKIDDNMFLGWPILPELNGYNIQNKVTDNSRLRHIFSLSELDSHPNKKGHEMIAEFIYENL